MNAEHHEANDDSVIGHAGNDLNVTSHSLQVIGT